MKNLFLVVIALVLCFAAFADSKTLSGGTSNDEQMTWCIARPSTDATSLYTNLNYSCSQSGVDCSPIKKGGSCFSPDTMMSHASYAMNLYYMSVGRNVWNCEFKGTGLIVSQNPSLGSCYYPTNEGAQEQVQPLS